MVRRANQTGSIIDFRGKRPIALIEENAHSSITAVGNDDIRESIRIEISRRQRQRIRGSHEGGWRAQGQIPLTHENADVTRCVENDDVLFAILVEVCGIDTHIVAGEDDIRLW